jgi:hypothetical protein
LRISDEAYGKANNDVLDELTEWVDAHQLAGKVGTYILKERMSEMRT